MREAILWGTIVAKVGIRKGFGTLAVGRRSAALGARSRVSSQIGIILSKQMERTLCT